MFPREEIELLPEERITPETSETEAEVIKKKRLMLAKKTNKKTDWKKYLDCFDDTDEKFQEI